jgi:hypothetical protein
LNQHHPESAPDVRGTDVGLRLAARLAQVSDRLHRAGSEVEASRHAVEGAVEVVPGCDESGVLLRGRRGTLVPVTNTSPALADLDELQCRAVDGRQPDPGSSPVPGNGMGSVLVLGLHLGGEDLGALTLYGRESNSFDERSGEIAAIYASHVAQALHHMRTVVGLRTALESRHDIGVAKGVLAVRYDLGYDEALSVLRRCSNETNVKLREVARQVMGDRSLPRWTG